MCGHGFSADSFVGYLGWGHSSSISLEVMGGGGWRWSCQSIRDIWLPSLQRICRCSCAMACDNRTPQFPLVELHQGWQRIQNISPRQEDKIKATLRRQVVDCINFSTSFFLTFCIYINAGYREFLVSLLFDWSWLINLVLHTVIYIYYVIRFKFKYPWFLFDF